MSFSATKYDIERKDLQREIADLKIDQEGSNTEHNNKCLHAGKQALEKMLESVDEILPEKEGLSYGVAVSGHHSDTYGGSVGVSLYQTKKQVN